VLERGEIKPRVAERISPEQVANAPAHSEMLHRATSRDTFSQCTNKAIKMMTGIGIPIKNRISERMI